jgi:SfnB family sulfur acquisition oxidoreductase
MSSLADAIVHSDLDVAPLLLPAQVLRNDAQALEAARALAQVARQQAARRDQQRKLPWSEIEQFTRSGLGSISIPRQYGGPEVSFVTLAEVFAIISAADPALGQIPQNQFGLLNLVLGCATEEQKKHLFKSVLEGWRIGNAGPERGTTNTLELKARLTADGVLNGQKFYSTGALFAHWVAVKALNDEGRQVLAFVRRGTPGLRIVDDWSGFGQRTTASGTILLNNVQVDADLVVDNWKINDTPNIQGAVSQLIQAAIDAGIARGAIDDAIDFVKTRARPWIDANVERASDDLYVIADIGKLKIELHAAEALLRKAGQVLDQVNTAPLTAESAARASIAVAEAKVLTTEISQPRHPRRIQPRSPLAQCTGAHPARPGALEVLRSRRLSPERHAAGAPFLDLTTRTFDQISGEAHDTLPSRRGHHQR